MSMEIGFPGGVVVEARHGELVIRTDQTKPEGGGSAPTPFDLFLASIGTCAGFYALRFCQERKISPEGLKATMDWERDPATRLISRIRVALTLPPGFPEKYVPAIVRAADQCAVKKHLVHPPEIEVFTV